MAGLSLIGVRKSFDRTAVLHGIDLEVGDGEFVAFVGPSGCGKSTLLRLIAGLDEVSGGTIAIDGAVVNDVPPARRGIAMVFQSYALYPHMTVAENMGYALRLAGTPAAERDARVRAAAAALRLEALLQRKPRQLSGGQRQRVAIGRAIVREPKIFLFDEPLSNLDAALRVEMRGEIARLKARLGTTMIYVTHDQVEAMTLADRIVVLQGGRVEQVGSPLELYRQPANRFVAGFIGSPRMNLLPATRDGQAVCVAGHAIPGLSVPAEVAELGLRPEDLTLVPPGEGLLAGEALLVEHLGSDVFAQLQIPGLPEPVMVRLPGQAALRRGEAVGLRFGAAEAHLFAADGARLPTRGAA
jgi:multiple sugar transport system ATP-binding protein